MLNSKDQAEELARVAKVFITFFRAKYGRNPDKADFVAEFIPHLQKWENEWQQELDRQDIFKRKFKFFTSG